jgi:hypothetical protein
MDSTELNPIPEPPYGEISNGDKKLKMYSWYLLATGLTNIAVIIIGLCLLLRG